MTIQERKDLIFIVSLVDNENGTPRCEASYFDNFEDGYKCFKKYSKQLKKELTENYENIEKGAEYSKNRLLDFGLIDFLTFEIEEEEEIITYELMFEYQKRNVDVFDYD